MPRNSIRAAAAVRRRELLELSSLRAVSDEHEPRLRHSSDRLDGRTERLLARESADEDERPGLERLGLDAERWRRRIGDNVDPVTP